jgi:hypothetical protein
MGIRLPQRSRVDGSCEGLMGLLDTPVGAWLPRLVRRLVRRRTDSVRVAIGT